MERTTFRERHVSDTLHTLGDLDRNDRLGILKRGFPNGDHLFTRRGIGRDLDHFVAAGADVVQDAGAVTAGDEFKALAIGVWIDRSHLVIAGVGELIDAIVVILLRRSAVIEQLDKEVAERHFAARNHGTAPLFIVRILTDAVNIQVAVGDGLALLDIGDSIDILRHHLGGNAGEIIGLVAFIGNINRQDRVLLPISIGNLRVGPDKDALLCPFRDVLKIYIIDDVNVIFEGEVVPRDLCGRCVGARRNGKTSYKADRR